MTTQRGIALILVILVTSFLLALGLGLALMVMTDRLATGNLRGSVGMLYAADAALEITARNLARIDDWSPALSGAVRGSFADGEPGGVRAIPGGGAVDLTESTNRLNCGRATSCSTAAMNASSRERPWGANNARWQLFAYGPLGDLVTSARPTPGYLAVWIADDGREADDDPLADAAADAPGHGILLIRAEAFGPFGVRRAIQAELVRQCLDAGEGECAPGIRVQSWQEIRQAVP